MKIYKQNNLNQNGIVSIITVALLAGVLALIATGFVKAMSSNQRQSLDTQLNTQAFYAAESAINDVKRQLRIDPTLGGNINNNQCTPAINYLNGLGVNNVLNPPSATVPIKYTCLMVNNISGPPPFTPVTFTPILGQSGFTQIKAVSSSSAINRLHFKWGDAATQTLRSNTNFPSVIGWGNSAPVLRVTIYFPDTDFSRANLMATQRTFFLVPVNSGSSSIPTNIDGAAVPINCNATGDLLCEADLQLNGNPSVGGLGIPPGYVGDGLFVRVKPLYTTSRIEIHGYSGGNEREIGSSQYTVDVTGRANDVYKRIKVTFGLDRQARPEYLEESGNDICKQFFAWPASTGNGVVDDPAGNCSL